jgi:hypothetical protein
MIVLELSGELQGAIAGIVTAARVPGAFCLIVGASAFDYNCWWRRSPL